MRLFASLVVLGFVAFASVPAMAQNNTNPVPGAPVAYGVPMYNGAANSYYNTQGGVPVYNNNSSTQPLPLNQLVAGKNAPSYNFTNNVYTGYGADPLAGADYNALTPEQYKILNARNEAAAQAQQAQYLAQVQQQAQANPYLNSATQMYNQFTQPEEQKPKKRRVVYKENNKLFATPPRLFNPDQ